MANGFDQLLAVLQAQAAEEAQRPSTLEKLNATFGNISKQAQDQVARNKALFEQKKAELEAQKLAREGKTYGERFSVPTPEQNKKRFAEMAGRVAGVGEQPLESAPTIQPTLEESNLTKFSNELGLDPSVVSGMTEDELKNTMSMRSAAALYGLRGAQANNLQNQQYVYVDPANPRNTSPTPVAGWLQVKPGQSLSAIAQLGRTDAQDRRAKEAQAFQLMRDQIKQDIADAKIPADKAGQYTLSNESILGIENAKNILFPDGTPESFQRTTAGLSNIPGFGPAPNNEEAQDLFRYIGNALAGRQLIQTGVAARPDETEALTKRFVANVFSNPESSFRAFNELQDFYRNYNITLTTKRPMTPGTQPSLPQANSAATPKRTDGKLMIDGNGRKAYVYPDGTYEKVP